MNHAPSTHEERLVEVCNSILGAISQLRLVSREAGKECPKESTMELIDRVLDIRNELAPPPRPTATTVNNTNPSLGTLNP